MEIEIFPRVAQAGVETVFNISNIPDDTTVRVVSKLYPNVFLSEKTDSEHISISFPFAGEYYIDINPDSEEHVRTPVFAVDERFKGLLPYKGDLHMHTTFSDGRKSPEVTVNKFRELGFDYICITDHDYYPSSQIAKDYAEEKNIDIFVMNGEEISLPDGGHVLSIGANSPVHMQAIERAELLKELNEYAEKMDTANLNKDISPHEYAPLCWAAEKIREKGGLSVLAHPFWVVKESGCYHLPRNVMMQTLKDNKTDAIEIPGHGGPESMMLALNLYAGLAETRMPMIANSDTHDSDGHVSGDRWQIAFCKEMSQKDIFMAIKNKMTAACEYIPGAHLQIFADFEMTEYAYFLSREYFPMKDAYALKEIQMLATGNDTTETKRDSAIFTSVFFSPDVQP